MRAVNLIAPQQSVARSGGRSNGAALEIVGLVAGLAILALVYGIAHRQVSSRRGEAATLSSQVQAAQARATQLAPYTSFASLHDQRLQAVTSLVDTRFDWAHVMHEVGRVLPQGTSISTLDGTMAAPTTTASPAPATGAASSGAVTSATPAGSVPSLKLTGCATSQSQVAETLDRLRLIDGVDEVKLESSTKAGSSGSGSSGGCPVAFNTTVAFDGLPASPTEGSR